MRRLAALGMALACSGCATHTWYARVPEAERSATLARSALRKGMDLSEVAQAMVEVRITEQDVSLVFRCPQQKIDLVLNAGQELLRMRSTRVYAGGFASIWVHDIPTGHLSTWGFRRQGDFLAAVRLRKQELLACDKASLSFNATPEGACGYDVIDIVFGSDGRIVAVSPVQPTTCTQERS